MWPFTPSRSNGKAKLARFRHLHAVLVPPTGECETWQGELLRIIANAEDEAPRKGFINRDGEDGRGLALFVEKLCADDPFDEETKEAIRGLGAAITRAGRDPSAPSPQSADWAFLFICAVEWCDAHPEPWPLRDDRDTIDPD